MALPVRLLILTGLPVLHQAHQLHQHHIQLAAVQADGVHRTLQTGHMAVVVSAPDIDDTVKATDGELVVMVGNIGGEVGGNAVGTHQNLVLFSAELGGLVPDSAVLLIGHAAVARAAWITP